jgi:hypothetical protein
MHETRLLLSLLRRVPPEVWTAVIWCSYTIYSVRFYLRIPGGPDIPWQHFKPAEWLLLAAATTAAVAGSALLRRWPLPAVGLLLAGSVAAALDVDSPTIHLAHYLAADIALGVIVAGRSRLTSSAALTAMLAVLPGYAILRIRLGYPPDLMDEWYLCATTAAVAWLAGNSTRLARSYAEELRARAAAEAATAERLRISRELHDSVAHSIGVIALQAGAAARVIDTFSPSPYVRAAPPCPPPPPPPPPPRPCARSRPPAGKRWRDCAECSPRPARPGRDRSPGCRASPPRAWPT